MRILIIGILVFIIGTSIFSEGNRSTSDGVTVWVTSDRDVFGKVFNTIYYKTYDSQRNRWETGSTVCSYAKNVINKDGVVVWVKREKDAYGKYFDSVYYTTYDQGNNSWQTSSAKGSGSSVLNLINNDGVIAWVRRGVDSYNKTFDVVYYTTYDRRKSSWQTSYSSCTYAKNLSNRNGVVRWINRKTDRRNRSYDTNYRKSYSQDMGRWQ